MDAETYDRWYETPRGRWIGQREVALLLGELQPRPDESLLDVGCGTGFFTRALAGALTGTVTGIDLNPDWVAYARRRNTANLFYEVADARALPEKDVSPTYSHIKMVSAVAEPCTPKEWGGYNCLFSRRLGGSAGGFGFGSGRCVRA